MRNDRYLHKDAKEEFRFWVKCNILKLIVVILILHDFFIPKTFCQQKIPEPNVISSFKCLHD